MKVSLSVWCPRCHAKKGKDCQHPSGRKCLMSHVERFNALNKKVLRQQRAFERTR